MRFKENQKQMRKLLFIFAIILTFACKKNNGSNNDLTNYDWTLSTATVTPAMTVNGKLETNYSIVQSGCIGAEVKFTFLNDGTYRFSAGGPACDYWNSPEQTYSRTGNEISLKNGSSTSVFNLVNNELRNIATHHINNITHTVEYVYIRKAK